MTKKEVVSVAKELNKVLGLDPQIDTKQDVEELKGLVLQAADLIEPEDEISEKTAKIIEELREEKAAAELEEEDEGEPEEDADDNGAEDDESEDEEEDDESESEDEEEDDEEEEEDEEEEDEPEEEEEKPTKTPATKKNKKETKPKEEVDKPTTMAGAMDVILTAGGSWGDITEATKKEAERLGFDPKKYSTGVIRAHAKSRLAKGTLNIKLTEEGVSPAKKK